MILKSLKFSALFFISLGLFFSLGMFAIKILFYNEANENISVIGPDITKVYNKPEKTGGYQVPNLDIDILNNKTALIVNEKLRPLPSKPELLPIQTNNEKKNIINESVKNLPILKKNKVKINKNKVKKKIDMEIKKNKVTNLVGMYRVQFGSFRDLNKAKTAIQNMNKKHKKLLQNIKLKIYSYKNNDNLIFHRVWSSLLIKKDGLKLCDQFKLKKIICILQVNN